MEYDRGDRFPFDFEPNGNPFGSKSKRKLSPRSYPIQCEMKWNKSFLSVASLFRLVVCLRLSDCCRRNCRNCSRNDVAITGTRATRGDSVPRSGFCCAPAVVNRSFVFLFMNALQPLRSLFRCFSRY